MLLQIEDQQILNLVKQLVQAHAYWRLKGLTVDLVIWNEDHGGYRQVFQNQILGLITAGIGANMNGQAGGIFMRSAEQISNEDRILISNSSACDDMPTGRERWKNRSTGGKLKAIIPAFTSFNLIPVQ